MVDSDAVVVRRCLAGDEAACRAFVGRFQGMVYGLCYRMLGHREDAEDVAQEVFLRAFRSLAKWDPTRPLKPWLLTIAANRCRTALRVRSKRPIPSEFVEPADNEAPAHDQGDLAEELQRALESVREEYRLCFVLFHQQELSVSEIGRVLECPVGTVKTWLHRARREIAEQLKRRGFGPEAQYELHGV